MGAYVSRGEIPDLLIYGSYPDIVMQPTHDKKHLALRELCGSYVYQDILNLDGIRHAGKIDNLLRLLAFQVGSQVSQLELSRSLSMSKDTVGKYITILEKAFIVFRLRGFSRNLRNEVTKQDKIYFHDTGIRNGIIENLNLPDRRDDMGRLWENFIISERLKTGFGDYIQVRRSTISKRAGVF